MRSQDSLYKTITLGKVEGSRKRGRSNVRWTDSLKEATDVSLQDLNKAAEDMTFWRLLTHGVAVHPG